MKNKKLNLGIEEIKKISMTDSEKNQIFENILKSSSESKKPISSPWFNYSFIFSVRKTQLVYYIVVPLIIILSSGGIAFASQDSLPSSILYPIKTNIIEPIEGILTFSAKDKAKHESKLATKRLVEAELLLDNGNLNKENEKKIGILLEDHTVALNKAIDKINKKNYDSRDETDKIITDFRAEMNAHARILEINNEFNNKILDDVNQNNDDNNIENEGYSISEYARESADKIKNKLENKKVKNSSDYTKRKESIKKLIDDADKDLVIKPNYNSEKEEYIENNTRKILNEAKIYLEESDKNDDEGNSDEAYSSLLDSESAIKETYILIENGQDIQYDNDSDR